MCGIVGVAGYTLQKDMKIFRDMLVFDQVRGFDSTGVVAVGPNESTPKLDKVLDGPENLWLYKKSEIFDTRGISKVSNKVMIGHNRAATIGDITSDNAHPFQHGNISGVHNGSLTYWWDLELDDKGKQFDVDSEALIKTIDVRGIDDAWESFYGAASLVWWNEEEETLNFIRNDERPMYFGHSLTENTLYFASEPWMIRVAASRNNTQLKMYEKKVTKDGVTETVKYDVYSTKEDHLIKFKVTATKVELVEERKLEGKFWLRSTRTSGTTLTTMGSLTTGDKINQTWAKGLLKAPRDMVGLTVKYGHEVTSFANGKPNPYFAAYIEETGERINLYPRTGQEHEEFLEDVRNGMTKFVIGCRPRILKYVGMNGKLEYGIEVNNLNYPDRPGNVVDMFPQDNNYYTSLGGRKVDEDTWHTNISLIGGCCDFCGMSIDINEANECKWFSMNVICPSCLKDGICQSYMTNH